MAKPACRRQRAHTSKAVSQFAAQRSFALREWVEIGFGTHAFESDVAAAIMTSGRSACRTCKKLTLASESLESSDLRPQVSPSKFGITSWTSAFVACAWRLLFRLLQSEMRQVNFLQPRLGANCRKTAAACLPSPLKTIRCKPNGFAALVGGV